MRLLMRLPSIATSGLRFVLVAVILAGSSVMAVPPPPSISKLGSEVFDDSRWLVDSLQLDVEDVLTAPLYVAAPQSPLRSRSFYLDLGLAAGWFVRP